MTRFIDMTDAQKGAQHQRLAAKERARLLATMDKVKARLAAIDAEADEIAASGGRFADKQAARYREEKQPILDHLKRHGIEI